MLHNEPMSINTAANHAELELNRMHIHNSVRQLEAYVVWMGTKKKSHFGLVFHFVFENSLFITIQNKILKTKKLIKAPGICMHSTTCVVFNPPVMLI